MCRRSCLVVGFLAEGDEMETPGHHYREAGQQPLPPEKEDDDENSSFDEEDEVSSSSDPESLTSMQVNLPADRSTKTWMEETSSSSQQEGQMPPITPLNQAEIDRECAGNETFIEIKGENCHSLYNVIVEMITRHLKLMKSPPPIDAVGRMHLPEPNADTDFILGELTQWITQHRNECGSYDLSDLVKIVEGKEKYRASKSKVSTLLFVVEVRVALTTTTNYTRKGVVPVFKAFRAVEDTEAGCYVRYGDQAVDVNDQHGSIDWPSARLFATKTPGLYLFMFDGLAENSTNPNLSAVYSTRFSLKVNGMDKAVSRENLIDEYEERFTRHSVTALLHLDQGDKVGIFVLAGKLLHSNQGTKRAFEINMSTRFSGVLLAH